MLVVLGLALLSLLQVSENAVVVLQWFVNLVTASQLINFSIVCFTYIRFKKACDAQGLLPAVCRVVWTDRVFRYDTRGRLYGVFEG